MYLAKRPPSTHLRITTLGAHRREATRRVVKRRVPRRVRRRHSAPSRTVAAEQTLRDKTLSGDRISALVWLILQPKDRKTGLMSVISENRTNPEPTPTTR